jgi:molecular chaperone HtpG
VDVLAHHLYSAPTVFVRELLQNAVDAIAARRMLEPKHAGRVRFEVDPSTRTIIVTDNGVGLTRAQIAAFLACVGASNKRGRTSNDTEQFIGQFGIGLLSCFMVADELVMLTRSIEPDAPPLEWRARGDGSYTVRTVQTDLAVGTRVMLQLRADAAEYAELPRLAGLLRRYGRFLEQHVTIQQTGMKRTPEHTSGERGLWRFDHEDGEAALEEVGWELGFRPLAAIPLHDAALGLEAVAYVLPEPATGRQAGAHWLYLKRMFVTDTDVKVVPRWASFVRCVLNSTRLRPTAAREALCEDEVFHATQRVIAARLSEYLHELARTRQPLLARILSIHDETMRQLARDDEEFFRLVIDLLPFETSRGPVRFGDFRAENTTVRLAPTVDQFRSCATIAAAQGITVFNGGYAQHAELLERAVALDPSLTLEIVDVRALLDGLAPVPPDGAPGMNRLLAVAQDALAPFGCRAILKEYEPADIPAVFTEGVEQSLARSLETAQADAVGFWKEALSALHAQIAASERGAFLCLNRRCDLLSSLARIAPPELLQAAVRVLYVQALLLGHQPLIQQETQAFTVSLDAILRAAIAGGGR